VSAFANKTSLMSFFGRFVLFGHGLLVWLVKGVCSDATLTKLRDRMQICDMQLLSRSGGKFLYPTLCYILIYQTVDTWITIRLERCTSSIKIFCLARLKFSTAHKFLLIKALHIFWHNRGGRNIVFATWVTMPGLYIKVSFFSRCILTCFVVAMVKGSHKRLRAQSRGSSVHESAIGTSPAASPVPEPTDKKSKFEKCFATHTTSDEDVLSM
jgi:hypothetical protein